jgi:hypothetical protein
VKHGPWPDLLVREQRAHALFIEMREERQEIESPLPGGVCRKVVIRQGGQVRPVIGRQHTPDIALWIVGRKNERQARAPARNVSPKPFAQEEKCLQEGHYRLGIETRRIDVEMQAERVQEYRPAATRSCRPQDSDDLIHLRQARDRDRVRDELSWYERGYRRAQPLGGAVAKSQAEFGVALGMDIAQVGLDRHAPKAGAADPESMRILGLKIAPDTANKRFGGSASAWAEKLYLDPDAPQCAICCNRARRAKRLEGDRNVMHHP